MRKLLGWALAGTRSLGAAAMAQQAKPLTAPSSDPNRMGWMQGFPPPEDKVIRFTDPDYFSFPKLRWTVCHFRELMPSVGVDNGAAGARALPVALDATIDDVTVTPLGSQDTMTWNAAFDANYTDGV